MASDALPVDGSGQRNLPVPVSPSLPAEMGTRDISQSSSRSGDMLDPVIRSLDVLSESVDVIADSVGSSDITIEEFDKLFEKYFSERVLTNIVVNALSRPAQPARENSLLVRQQAKAHEVCRKSAAKDGSTSDPSGYDINSSKTLKKKVSFHDGYNKILQTTSEVAKNPLLLVDKLLGAGFKGLDAIKNKFSDKMRERRNENANFYGGSVGGTQSASTPASTPASSGKSHPQGSISGLVEDTGAFFGDLKNSVELKKKMATMSPSDRLMGAAAIGMSGGADGVTSASDDVYEEAAEIGVKADTVLYETYKDPENSKFGKMMSEGEDGGGGGKKSGLLKAAIIGLILVGLLAFRDVVSAIFHRVLIPLGEVVIDVLRAIKQPLINFLSAFIDIALVVLGIIKDVLVAVAPIVVRIGEVLVGIVAVVLGVIKDILEAIAPYLIEVATIICSVVVTVLEIVRDILVAVAPFLIRIAEVVAGVIVVVLGIIKDVLETIAPYIPEFISILLNVVVVVLNIIKDVLERISPYIADLFEIISGTVVVVLGLVKDLLETLKPHIIRIADVVGDVVATIVELVGNIIKIIATPFRIIARVLEAIEDPIVRAMTIIANRLVYFLEKNQEFLDGIFYGILKVVEVFFSGVVYRLLSNIDNLLAGMAPHMSKVGDNIGNIAANVSGIAANLSGIARRVVDEVVDPIAHGLVDVMSGPAQLLGGFLSWAGDGLTAVMQSVGWMNNLMNYQETRATAQFQEISRVYDEGVKSFTDNLNTPNNQLDVLKGIHRHTAFIANLLAVLHGEYLTYLDKDRFSVNDAIITADGRIIETAPNDAIIAIQNGTLTAPSPSVFSSVSSNNNSSSQSSATNVYNTSNISTNNTNPFSGFHPVGV